MGSDQCDQSRSSSERSYRRFYTSRLEHRGGNLRLHAGRTTEGAGAWADGPYVRLTAFRRNGLREIAVLLWRGPAGQVLMYADIRTFRSSLAGRA